MFEVEEERNSYQKEIEFWKKKLNETFWEETGNLTKKYNEAIQQLKQQHAEQLLLARPDFEKELLNEIVQLRQEVKGATTDRLSFSMQICICVFKRQPVYRA